MYNFLKLRYLAGKLTGARLITLAGYWLSTSEVTKLLTELNIGGESNG